MNCVGFIRHGLIASYDHTMSFHYLSQSFLDKHELKKNIWGKNGIAKESNNYTVKIRQMRNNKKLFIIG
jgi:hypothetical protein